MSTFHSINPATGEKLKEYAIAGEREVDVALTAATYAFAELQSHPPPLPIRLVDSGGVGIPLTERWGSDYSHDARIFHASARRGMRVAIRPPLVIGADAKPCSSRTSTSPRP